MSILDWYSLYYWLQKLVLVLYWNCMELLCRGHRIVLVFYCQNKNDQNWYWYFIAKIKMFRIGIGILLLSKSLPCPTLACADSEARTPIGVSRNSSSIEDVFPVVHLPYFKNISAQGNGGPCSQICAH